MARALNLQSNTKFANFYDSAGWTLAFQMGVKFDRILDGFDGPFEKIAGFAKVPAGKVVQAKATTGYLLTHQMNDSFIALNQLLKGGNEEIFFLNAPLSANGKTYPAGTIYIPSKATTAGSLQKLTDLGLKDIDARVAFSPHAKSNSLLKKIGAKYGVEIRATGP